MQPSALQLSSVFRGRGRRKRGRGCSRKPLWKEPAQYVGIKVSFNYSLLGKYASKTICLKIIILVSDNGFL